MSQPIGYKFGTNSKGQRIRIWIFEDKPTPKYERQCKHAGGSYAEGCADCLRAANAQVQELQSENARLREEVIAATDRAVKAEGALGQRRSAILETTVYDEAHVGVMRVLKENGRLVQWREDALDLLAELRSWIDQAAANTTEPRKAVQESAAVVRAKIDRLTQSKVR